MHGRERVMDTAQAIRGHADAMAAIIAKSIVEARASREFRGPRSWIIRFVEGHAALSRGDVHRFGEPVCWLTTRTYTAVRPLHHSESLRFASDFTRSRIPPTLAISTKNLHRQTRDRVILSNNVEA